MLLLSPYSAEKGTFIAVKYAPYLETDFAVVAKGHIFIEIYFHAPNHALSAHRLPPYCDWHDPEST